MSPGAAGLLGAIIGGVIVLVTTWATMTQRFELREREWEREDQFRWTRERRQIYAKFVAQMASGANWFFYGVTIGHSSENMLRSEEYLSKTQEEFATYMEIEMIATPDVRKAARHAFIWRGFLERQEIEGIPKFGADKEILDWIRRVEIEEDDLELTPEEVDERRYQHVIGALYEFVEAARAELTEEEE